MGAVSGRHELRSKGHLFSVNTFSAGLNNPIWPTDLPWIRGKVCATARLPEMKGAVDW